MSTGEITYINGKRVASPEYRAWGQLKNRCKNTRGQDWKYYGGRGITFDPAWEVFENFLEDMGRRPAPHLTLERKDGNQPYCKENCVWASRQMQSRNRAYVRLSLAAAEEIRLRYIPGVVRQIDLAKEYGVSQLTISNIVCGKSWRPGTGEKL